MICRACGRLGAQEVLDLGHVPLANDLRAPGAPPSTLYPLHLVICESCALVQLAETVPPSLLFGGDYPYHSSVNGPYVAQEHALADRLIDSAALGPDDIVVEIGSNDGYLLTRYAERGVRVLGVEPAGNLSLIAEARGVPTVNAFFGQQMAEQLVIPDGHAMVVHANNVLAHVPDILDVLKGIAVLLAPEGACYVETPDVAFLVALAQWDTIYHEHLFYWSVTAFARTCRRAGLTVVDVERIPSHCGSLRIEVRRAGCGSPTERVAHHLRAEHDRGLDGVDGFASFADRVAVDQEQVSARIMERVESGAVIAGYGAAAKGAMLLHGLVLPDHALTYVVDATPAKQGLLMPGTDVPIVDPARFVSDPPDCVVILAWNFADAIISQHPEYQGEWIVPKASTGMACG